MNQISGMDIFKTNNYLENVQMLSEELQSEREQFGIFMKFHMVGSTKFGCRYSTKCKSKNSIRYDCSVCRRHIDKSKRDFKKDQNIPIIKETSSYFMWKDGDIEWVKGQHIQQCTLEEYGEAICRTGKNRAVVNKSKFGTTSKQAFDGELRVLLREHKEDLTARNINNGYGSFKKSRSALDKAHKRVGAPSTSNFLNETGFISKEKTVIIPTLDLNEDSDYFLVYESPQGSKILGTKFLIEKWFSSEIALSDGTFKIAPNGFSQTYIVWFAMQGQCEGELISRNQGIPAAYFLMKTKSIKEYEELFNALEQYR